jgi:hypothetical protein
MEKALTKLGSFTIPRKAKQELSAIGGDLSVSSDGGYFLPFVCTSFSLRFCYLLARLLHRVQIRCFGSFFPFFSEEVTVRNCTFAGIS